MALVYLAGRGGTNILQMPLHLITSLIPNVTLAKKAGAGNAR